MFRCGWVFVLLLVCVPAEAQLTMMREHVRQMDTPRVAVGGELGGFFDSVDSALSPTVLASARLGELVIEGAFPFAYAHQRNQPTANVQRLAVANPWLGLSFLPDTSCGLARLSLGMAFDLADDGASHAARTLELAREVRGDWDGYLYRDHLLPLVAGVGTLKDLGKLRLAWEADLVFGLPAASRSFEFGVQTAGEAGLRFRWHTNLGLRAMLTTYPTLDDSVHGAASLFLRHARPRGDSFGAQFLVNLLGPRGVSFEAGGVWGATLFYATSL